MTEPKLGAGNDGFVPSLDAPSSLPQTDSSESGRLPIIDLVAPISTDAILRLAQPHRLSTPMVSRHGGTSPTRVAQEVCDERRSHPTP